MRTNAPRIPVSSLLLAVAMTGAGCGAGAPLGPPAAGGSGGGPPVAAGGETGSSDAGSSGQTGANGGAGATGHPGSCGAALVGDAARSRWIAFDSDRADFRRQLYMMHPDGSGAVRLLSDAFIDKEPSFSPDGARIAFTSNRAGASQIFLLDIEKKLVTKVTTRPEGADEPSFSHDGARIAFHSGGSVYVIGVGGDGERLVGTGLDDFNAYFWPHFSLDDNELVFDRNNEIDAMGITSATLRNIVGNTTTTIKTPAVSPDGNDVAYYADCFTSETTHSIWTTPFSTSTEVCKGRRVTPPDDFGSERPAWGTTSLLAYERIDTKTNLASIALISRQAGSQPCVLTPAGSDNRNPSWSP